MKQGNGRVAMDVKGVAFINFVVMILRKCSSRSCMVLLLPLNIDSVAEPSQRMVNHVAGSVITNTVYWMGASPKRRLY